MFYLSVPLLTVLLILHEVAGTVAQLESVLGRKNTELSANTSQGTITHSFTLNTLLRDASQPTTHGEKKLSVSQRDYENPKHVV